MDPRFAVGQQFSSQALPAQMDYTLVGATPKQLHGWGYTVSGVPRVDDRIDLCLPLVGAPQTRC